MTAEDLYAMEAETGRTSEWEPLYRAEKARADAAEAAVARVRALHALTTWIGEPVCDHCDKPGEPAPYPCATVRALDAP